MRNSALAIPLAVAALASLSQLDRTIVPGERIGPISSATSEAELNELFGSAAVSVAEIYLSEGVCSSGTVVLPDTPDRLEVTWADSARSHIAFVRIAREGSSWRTVRGVGVGTSLAELERIKGGSVEFTGFEWDFGGAMHWPAGTVEPGDGREPQVLLLLDPHLADGSVSGAELDTAEIFGDMPVRSDHPVIRRLDITVREMIVSWDRPYEQIECETEPSDQGLASAVDRSDRLGGSAANRATSAERHHLPRRRTCDTIYAFRDPERAPGRPAFRAAAGPSPNQAPRQRRRLEEKP